MSVASDLLRAEWLKLRSTRTSLGLLAGLAVLVAALVAITLAAAKGHTLEHPSGVRSVLVIGGNAAYIFALAMGIVGSAGEYRHGTITLATLATPQRWPLLAAKVLVYAVAGLLFAALATGITFAIAALVLPSHHSGLHLSQPMVQRVLFGSLIAGAVFGVIGVGLGMLLREQVVALLLGVGWTLIVDSVISGAAPDVGKFFPGGAVSGVMQTSSKHVLSMGQSALLLTGYAAAFAAAGAVLFQQRDVS